jgi:hypothetical protein
VKRSLRFHFSTELTRNLRFLGRWELVGVDNIAGDSQNGFLGFVEAWCKVRPRVQTDLRLQYFETSGYDSRIYVYEPDVPSAVSIPAFYDKGLHYYINVNLVIDKRLRLWMRWNQSIFLKTAGFVSEKGDTQDNKNSQIKMQLEWVF